MTDPDPERPPDLPAPGAPDPASEAAGPGAAPRLLVTARIVVPFALAIVGYAVLIAQRWSIDHELQIVAPEAVRPGDPIPARAYLFAGIDAAGDDPGELADLPIELALVCGARTEASATLEPAALHSAEGGLRAPAAPGDCELRASARASGEVLATARRSIAISADAAPAPGLGRLASELQLLRVGPVASDDPAAAPPAMHVRVSSGTCVPEQPCELLVHAPDVDSVTIEETAAATLRSAGRDGGLHVLSLVANGPEVAITLLAWRAGARVAHAEVQVPVALATPWIHAPRAAPEVAFEVVPPPGRSALIIDRYRDGRWIETLTVPGGPARLEASAPGLHRIQARADPFSGGAVIARYVLVGEPLERVPELLEAEGIEPADPPGSPPVFLLASAEEEIRQLPAATSGLEDDRARLAERRRTVQIVGAVALGLGILVFLLSLLRRGLRAAEEARGVMAAAGDETAGSRSTRIRMTFAVLLFVGAVAVALLAGASLILARAALVAP